METSAVRILYVDGQEVSSRVIDGILQTHGYLVETVGGSSSARVALGRSVYDAVLFDVSLHKKDGMDFLRFLRDEYPNIAVIVLTGASSIKTAVDCMKEGAFTYVLKPSHVDELPQVLERALLYHTLLRENTILRSVLERVTEAGGRPVGESAAFRRVLELAEKVGPSEENILIRGERGVGKDVLARFLHQKSSRASIPLVSLHCSSVPDGLLESELFGYERGAFPGAFAMKEGLLELAHRGTLLLDEVAELSPLVQSALLRYLETGEFKRVGGTTIVRADVRIFSLTSKDLPSELEQGRFRPDLLAKLNPVTIEVPPLRDRKQDIPLLVEHLLRTKLPIRQRKNISAEALGLLMSHEWPGNVEELEKVLETAAMLSPGEFLRPRDLLLPPNVFATEPRPQGGWGRGTEVEQMLSLKDVERRHIADVLLEEDWNKRESARILGISLKTLYTKIAQYGLRQS